MQPPQKTNIPRYLNINGHASLVRDTQSMGVVNTNYGAFKKSQRNHALAMKKLEEQRAKDRELNTLRKDVAELKQLVTQILETKKNADCTDPIN
jgi:hypothetical protein